MRFGMGVTSDADPVGAFQSAFKQSKLARLLTEAQNPQMRQNALAQMLGVDRQAAYEAQRAFAEQDKLARDQFGNDAKMAYALSRGKDQSPAQAAWARLRQSPMGQALPEQYDPNVLAAIGGNDETYRPHVIGDSLVDSTGKVLYSAPDRPKYALKEFGGRLYYVPESPMPQQPSGNTPTQDAGFNILSDAVKWQESRGNPNAVSPKGAVGTMQTMPGTLRDPGYGVNPARDNSPQELERVGIDYLRAMTEKYGTVGGLAAYNWGPGNWEKALAASGGDPQRALAMAPAETQQYVPSVLQRFQGGAGMGFGTQGAQVPSGAIPVPGVAESVQTRDAPSGYMWGPDGKSLIPIPGGPADRKNNPVASDLSKGEMGMRKELDDKIKQDRTVMGMFQNIENAVKAENAAGDLSAIFAFMKMLDPGSVVREQEFANAQNAAGVPDRIRNLYNQAKRGTRLTPSQRAEFMNEARKLANSAQSRITAQTREYQNIADEYGYDPRRSTGMPDFRNVQGGPQPSGQQAPPSGSVDDLLSKYGVK